MSQNQSIDLTQSLERLCAILDKLENRLRIYDAAFQFFKANNPNHAALLDDSLVMAEAIPQVQAAASAEHVALHQESLELVSRVLQGISNLSKDLEDCLAKKQSGLPARGGSQ